jgi:hypothetical protein
MRRIVGGILAVAAPTMVCGHIIASALGSEPKYIQSGCEISESYFAYIYMTAESEAGKPNARKYSVEFNPERLIVRFRPAYYALKWEDTTIVVEYRGENSDEAMLSLRNYGFSTSVRTCYRRSPARLLGKSEGLYPA